MEPFKLFGGPPLHVPSGSDGNHRGASSCSSAFSREVQSVPSFETSRVLAPPSMSFGRKPSSRFCRRSLPDPSRETSGSSNSSFSARRVKFQNQQGSSWGNESQTRGVIDRASAWQTSNEQQRDALSDLPKLDDAGRHRDFDINNDVVPYTGKENSSAWDLETSQKQTMQSLRLAFTEKDAQLSELRKDLKTEQLKHHETRQGFSVLHEKLERQRKEIQTKSMEVGQLRHDIKESEERFVNLEARFEEMQKRAVSLQSSLWHAHDQRKKDKQSMTERFERVNNLLRHHSEFGLLYFPEDNEMEEEKIQESLCNCWCRICQNPTIRREKGHNI